MVNARANPVRPWPRRNSQDHPAGLEEDDLLVFRSPRFQPRPFGVKAPGSGEAPVPERDDADTLVHCFVFFFRDTNRCRRDRALQQSSPRDHLLSSRSPAGLLFRDRNWRVKVRHREGQKHGPCDGRVCRTRSHFSSSLFNPFRSRCTNPASEANCASDMSGSRKRVNSSSQPLPLAINRMGT
jgi:hypothetical protein